MFCKKKKWENHYRGNFPDWEVAIRKQLSSCPHCFLSSSLLWQTLLYVTRFYWYLASLSFSVATPHLQMFADIRKKTATIKKYRVKLLISLSGNLWKLRKQLNILLLKRSPGKVHENVVEFSVKIRIFLCLVIFYFFTRHYIDLLLQIT